MTDGDFIVSLYTGNQQRLTQLIKMNCISSSVDDIDDCVEDVLLIVVKNVRKIKRYPNKEEWLNMVARNVTADFNRNYIKKLNRSLLNDNEIYGDEYSLIKLENERIKKKIAVMKLIRSLSDDYKEIYFLRYNRKLSYNKISQIIGICPDIVGTKVSRINEMLRSEIKK